MEKLDRTSSPTTANNTLQFLDLSLKLCNLAAKASGESDDPRCVGGQVVHKALGSPNRAPNARHQEALPMEARASSARRGSTTNRCMTADPCARESGARLGVSVSAAVAATRQRSPWPGCALLSPPTASHSAEKYHYGLRRRRDCAVGGRGVDG